MSYNPKKFTNIKHGDLIISRHGSVGIIKDSIFNREQLANYYEIVWFNVVPVDYNMLTFSLYFTEYEVQKMKRRAARIRSKLAKKP